MSISVQQLLGKMEKELREAKGLSQNALVRERVHAIKLLCELILENGGETQQASSMPVSSYPAPAPVPQFQPQAPAIQPAKRLEMEDEANGDSLFDF